MFRKLRIAFSVVCGIVCLLLVAMWVLSYWRCDFIGLRVLNDYAATVASVRGQVVASAYEYGVGDQRAASFFSIYKLPANSVIQIGPRGQFHDQQLFSIRRINGGLASVAPHWFLALVFAIIAAAPWLTSVPRFSLRTLLIATTLVAVALGLVVAIW